MNPQGFWYLVVILLVATVGTLAQDGSPIMCTVRQQALVAASKLLPGCRRGDAVACTRQRTDVFNNIGLTNPCMISTIPPNNVPLGSEIQDPIPTPAHSFFVSPSGSDSNNGLSKGAPFKTIQKAIDSVATAGNGNKLVTLLSGQYRITQGLQLSNSHSNTVLAGDPTADIGSAKITSAILLDRATNPWTSVGNGVVKCQLSPSIVNSLDSLSMLFVGGQAAIRARAPNVNLATDHLFDVRMASKWVEGPQFPIASALTRLIIPVDGSVNTQYAPFLYRFSNYTVGYIDTTQITSPYDPPVSYFLNPIAVAQGGCTLLLPTAVQWSSGVFTSQWANATTGLFHTMNYYGWGDMVFPITTQTPTSLNLGTGGWQQGRGDCGLGGQSWFVENVQELLDSPNEFFLSLATNELFYIPSSDAMNPLLNSSLTIELTSSVKVLMSIMGPSNSEPAANIRIQNVQFFGAYYTTMDKYEVPSGGDYSFHRSGALYIEKAANITINDNLFYWCFGNGITISRAATNIVVNRNELYAIGANAIVTAGDPGYYTPDPWVIKDYPDGVQIIGNLVSYLGLHVMQASAFFSTLSMNVLVQGNVFYWGPRAGITLNDQWGSGTYSIRQNLIFQMTQGTSDIGPFILWHRQQYDEPTPKAYDVLEENFLIGTPGLGTDGGGKGIDVDDGAHRVLSNKNVIAAGFHKIKGDSIHVTNNLIIQPIMGGCAFFSYWNRIPADWKFTSNTCISSKYPAYVSGVSGKALNPMCTSTAYFTATNNSFYITSKANIISCMKNWNTWTKKLHGDSKSKFVKKIPTAAAVGSMIADLLSWFPQ